MKIFDIGANIGKWSLVNSQNASNIISVEADPDTYSKLVLLCNSQTHILCENYAVCDSSNDTITFYKCTTADTISTLNRDWLANPLSRFNNYPYTEIVCKTITLDKLIEKHGIPNLIKIDVEGGEYECIRSLTQKVESLCFEWASETNYITYKCLDYLQSLGYDKFYLQHEDMYTFRPTTFYTIDIVREQLANTTPKKEWGMIWCA
jgi:FkbM family methyltransferase